MTAAILTLAPYSPPDIADDVREASTPHGIESFRVGDCRGPKGVSCESGATCHEATSGRLKDQHADEPQNDASRTLLLGSASGSHPDSGLERSRTPNLDCDEGPVFSPRLLAPLPASQQLISARSVYVLIIAALLTFASGICLGQSDGIPRYKVPLVPRAKTAETPAPAAGPLDRWEARFDTGLQKVDTLATATDNHTAALGAIGDNVKEFIETAKALGVGAFWLVILGGCFALAYKVLDIVKAWMLLLASRKDP